MPFLLSFFNQKVSMFLLQQLPFCVKYDKRTDIKYGQRDKRNNAQCISLSHEEKKISKILSWKIFSALVN